MSHMTVWRTRARLAEEARLQAEIAAMPATATAPKVREQEQLAAYLAVPVQALKALSAQSSGGYGGMRGATTPALIKTLARDAALHDRSPRQVAKDMAETIERLTSDEATPREPRRRPSMSKAAVAARKAEAHRVALTVTLDGALDDLVELYPFTPEELEDIAGGSIQTYTPAPHGLKSWWLPYCPTMSRPIAQGLTYARTVSSLCGMPGRCGCRTAACASGQGRGLHYNPHLLCTMPYARGLSGTFVLLLLPGTSLLTDVPTATPDPWDQGNPSASGSGDTLRLQAWSRAVSSSMSRACSRAWAACASITRCCRCSSLSSMAAGRGSGRQRAGRPCRAPPVPGRSRRLPRRSARTGSGAGQWRAPPCSGR